MAERASQRTHTQTGVLLCPIEDWNDHEGDWVVFLPLLLGVISAIVLIALHLVELVTFPPWINLGIPCVLFGSASFYSAVVYRRGVFAEARARRNGNHADRYRAFVLLARLRFKAKWWRFSKSIPGAQLVLIGLRPDPIQLAEVQATEAIDISTSPRLFSMVRPVRYREIHITAVCLAGVASLIANRGVGATGMPWIYWALLMFPFAWVLVWLFRRARVSSLWVISPFQLVSTVVEPGRVTRTIFGITRVYDAASSVLVIRASVKSAKHLQQVPVTRMKVRATLINSRGQSSTFELLGADHPSIADLIARWTYPRYSDPC